MKFVRLARVKRLWNNLVRKILYLAVGVYQFCISPFMFNSCRYYPSSSSYCRDSILSFGVVKGCFLTFKRLAKCHPLSQGGFDPVPDSEKD